MGPKWGPPGADRTQVSPISWVQSGGPVSTESIVRFDTWFELFEVFRKKIRPHDPCENGGGICEKLKSKMAAGGHIGNVT